MKLLVFLLLVLGVNGVADGLNTSSEGPFDMEALEQACDDGNGRACMRLATIYENFVDTDVQKDMKKAFSYWSKGCELNDKYSCSDVGRYYYLGLGGVEVDKAKAKHFIQKECDLNNYKECTPLKTLPF